MTQPLKSNKQTKPSTEQEYICHECGEEFAVTVDGTNTHFGNDETDGFELDADHVPYSLENQ